MELKITDRQKHIVIGSVLGDGYLDFNGCRGTRLQVKQSEKRKEYIEWLHKELENLCLSKPNKSEITNNGISVQDT